MLHAEGGARVNAGAPPALALEEGVLVRFTGSLDAADPDYFRGPTRAALAASPRERRGTLHASVCPVGERVCRAVRLDVRVPPARP